MSSEPDNLKTFLTKCFDTVASVNTYIVYEKLVELGAESIDDLKYLNETDLGFMKPVHLRKFLSRVKGSKPEGQEPAKKETVHVKPLPQTPGHQSSPSTWSNFNVKALLCKMPEILIDIEADKRLNADTRRNFVRGVIDEVRKVSKHGSKKEFEVISQRVVGTYPNTFEDRIGGVIIGTGYDSLMKQLIARNENLNRKIEHAKTVSTEQTLKKENEPSTSRKRLCQKDTYGCVNWGPTLNDRESEEQEKIRKELQDMRDVVKADDDWDRIYEGMNGAYGLLRKHINDGETLQQLLVNWPYLVHSNVLLQHCKLLLGLNVQETIETANLQKAPILLKYFKSKKAVLGLAHHLSHLEHEKVNDNFQAILSGVILCIQKCLGEGEQSLMFPVDEMASNEEIENFNTESWPRLAMLGESSLTAKTFALVVDKKVIGRYSSYLTALSVLFNVYYIFNIEYQSENLYRGALLESTLIKVPRPTRSGGPLLSTQGFSHSATT